VAAVLVVAGALVVTGVAVALGQDGPRFDPSAPGRGIDARAYYTDYEQGEDDNGGVAYGTTADGAAEDGGGTEPGLLEDNTFVEAGTSGFVAAAADPRSTFALDADTGSWTVGRTLLRSGHRPPPASIRPEEWVNAQPYADPAPTRADLAISASTGAAPALADGTRLVRLGIAAREVAPADRPPLTVTLVVDRSGSMDIRERLGLVQASLALLAGQLRDDDRVAVVTFDEAARPILAPTPVRETGRILEAIDQLRPGGSTNLEGGLALGYETARRAHDPAGTNVVVLCSDGVANVGRTGPGSILETITDGGRDGIHLVTVGFGMGNYNDHLMEQLADRGDGFYGYVDTFAEAERLFVDELTTTLVPVAGDARTQVRFDPAAVSSYRLVGYDNRTVADDDFDDPSVDAGELGSGHRVSALYEVRVRPGTPADAVIARAGVAWTPVGGGGQRRADVDVLAGDPAADGDPGLRLAAAAADLSRLLKGVPPYAGPAGGAAAWSELEGRVDRLSAEGVPGAAALADLVHRAAVAG
jgi:Ca-activated chloride channel family protein